MLGASAAACGSLPDGPVESAPIADIEVGEIMTAEEPEALQRAAEELAAEQVASCAEAVGFAVARSVDSGQNQAVADGIARDLGMQTSEYVIWRDLNGETTRLAYSQGSTAAADFLAAESWNRCGQAYGW